MQNGISKSSLALQIALHHQNKMTVEPVTVHWLAESLNTRTRSSLLSSLITSFATLLKVCVDIMFCC